MVMGFSIALIIIVLIVLYSLARTAGESDRTMEQIRESNHSLEGRRALVGTVEKRDKHKKRRFVSPEEKLERELKDCMHCRFFWGHNNRCANGTCCKPSKKKEQKLPTECVGCPYYRGNGYCFPCMRKLIGK